MLTLGRLFSEKCVSCSQRYLKTHFTLANSLLVEIARIQNYCVFISIYQGLGGHSDDLEKRINNLEEQISAMKRLREKVMTTHLTAYLISCVV